MLLSDKGGIEDNIDTSISLTLPKDYEPEHGCRFVVDFTKKRISQEHIDAVASREMTLEAGADGLMSWRTEDVKVKSKKAVIEALDQGMNQTEAANISGVGRSWVSQIVKEAHRKGWLDEENRLTDKGKEKFSFNV